MNPLKKTQYGWARDSDGLQHRMDKLIVEVKKTKKRWWGTSVELRVEILDEAGRALHIVERQEVPSGGKLTLEMPP